MPSSVNVPVVDQQREPLARGQLVGGVLLGDLLLATAEPRGRAALVQLLDQRAQRASTACGCSRTAPTRASPPAGRDSASSSGASKAVISTPITSPTRPPRRAGRAAPRWRARRRRETARAARSGRARRGRGGRRPRRPSSAPATSVSGGAVPTPRALEFARARRRRGRARRHMTTRAGSSTSSAEPRVPAPAGGGQAHAAEEAARRRVRRVEVAVRVEPQRSAPPGGGAARPAASSMQIEQSEASRTGKSPVGHRVVDLAAGLEQAAARVAQVVGEVARPRLAGRADQPRLDAEQPPEPGRERLGAAAATGRPVRRPAAQRDDGGVAHRPVQTGSRFSKNAFTPSWMSSVANAIASCARR